MTTEPEEEALSWDGEKADPSLATGREPRSSKADKTDPPKVVAVTEFGVSSFLLVTYGILAGAYLIYTLGWFIGVKHVNSTDADTLSQVAGVVTQVLAIGSGAVWFAGAFFLTRHRAPLVRVLLLLAGLVILVPWPFVLLGGVN